VERRAICCRNSPGGSEPLDRGPSSYISDPTPGYLSLSPAAKNLRTNGLSLIYNSYPNSAMAKKDCTLNSFMYEPILDMSAYGKSLAPPIHRGYAQGCQGKCK
jgi:hypothetical protein